MDGWNWLTALIVALLSYYVMLTSSETVKAQNTKCNLAQFKCANGTCIASSKYCDGTIDCIDGSDEVKSCTGESLQYNNLRHPMSILMSIKKFDRLTYWIASVTKDVLS